MKRGNCAAISAALFLGLSVSLMVGPTAAWGAVSLGNVVIDTSGWRYNMTVMREQAKTDPFKAEQYAYYLDKMNVTDEYIVAYAAAVDAKFNGGSSAESGSGFVPDPILGNAVIDTSGWRYNMTVMREQAKTDPFKAEQYAAYLVKMNVTDAYVAAYAAAVEAMFGSGSGTPNDGGSTGGSTGGNTGGSSSVVPLSLKDRVLLHRAPARGMEYVPTAKAGSSASGKSSLGVDVLNKINLDGNPITNVYSSVLPLDYNKNGTSEFLHWNGHRIMRLYGSGGNKIWQVTNSTGRTLGSEAYTHRDSAAILDLNGDKIDDVLHCWQSGSTKQLVARDGKTGKAIKTINLSGQSNGAASLCLISVYRQQATKKPIVLVAHQQPGGSAKCNGKNWVDNWTQVAAFDTSLKELWKTDTCHAGHVTAGVDANNDGYQEYFFVGKYALDFNGKIRCTLKGWTSTDHVDAIRVAKLDPNSSRITAVAVGMTGGGAFDASNCKWLWGFSKLIPNPQELGIAQLDPAPKPLSITVTERGSSSGKTHVLDASGKIVKVIGARLLPLQNAELDGDARTDEIVSMFGEVYNGAGKRILSKNWYWDLKGSKVTEKSTSNIYDRWVAFPLLYDVNNDGKDELVTWSQSLIVVGKLR
ncbi:hypothetical protein [Geminicoccus roseus]|uniref:hypothetical protein n=1 Tax=Geminicoccus roseus TaxID=404900 RepID=UPI00041EB8BB|nr:hypothetical protein [Geminicoccus roseus]